MLTGRCRGVVIMPIDGVHVVLEIVLRAASWSLNKSFNGAHQNVAVIPCRRRVIAGSLALVCSSQHWVTAAYTAGTELSSVSAENP